MGNGKVLVTGGCGFIGPYLCKKLMEMGKHVVSLDIIAGQSSTADGPETVKGDIRDRDLISGLLADVDTVYHLAGMTEFADCRDDPRRAFDVNARGTTVMLQEAVKHGVGNFVFFSSASVYSGNKEPAKHEGMKLTPNSIYSITKLMGERLCGDIGMKHGLPCASLRLFNVYGKRGRGVINLFARALKADKHIVIYGDGNQIRDYIHVDDVVKATIAIGERRLSGAYNIGTGNRCVLIELKKMMEEISGETFKVEWQPRRAWDLQEHIADTRKIKEILPTTIPLEDGLRALLEGSREGDQGTRKSSLQALSGQP